MTGLRSSSSSSRAEPHADIEQAATFRAELRRFLNRIEVATGEAGLTPQRFDLLLAIKAAGDEATINELCSDLNMQQTAVTELVKRAQENGLVTRTQSTVDRRVVLVHTTANADARFDRAFSALQADHTALVGALERVMGTLDAPQPELHSALEIHALSDVAPPLA